MAKALRSRFRVVLLDDEGQSVATSITVEMPSGLTREQAADYATGRVLGEFRRYMVYEGLGLTYTDHDTKWDEIVT